MRPALVVIRFSRVSVYATAHKNACVFNDVIIKCAVNEVVPSWLLKTMVPWGLLVFSAVIFKTLKENIIKGVDVRVRSQENHLFYFRMMGYCWLLGVDGGCFENHFTNLVCVRAIEHHDSCMVIQRTSSQPFYIVSACRGMPFACLDSGRTECTVHRFHE